jgi:hypothetical protein
MYYSYIYPYITASEEGGGRREEGGGRREEGGVTSAKHLRAYIRRYS